MEYKILYEEFKKLTSTDVEELMGCALVMGIVKIRVVNMLNSDFKLAEVNSQLIEYMSTQSKSSGSEEELQVSDSVSNNIRDLRIINNCCPLVLNGLQTTCRLDEGQPLALEAKSIPNFKIAKHDFVSMYSVQVKASGVMLSAYDVILRFKNMLLAYCECVFACYQEFAESGFSNSKLLFMFVLPVVFLILTVLIFVISSIMACVCLLLAIVFSVYAIFDLSRLKEDGVISCFTSGLKQHLLYESGFIKEAERICGLEVRWDISYLRRENLFNAFASFDKHNATAVAHYVHVLGLLFDFSPMSRENTKSAAKLLMFFNGNTEKALAFLENFRLAFSKVVNSNVLHSNRAFCHVASMAYQTLISAAHYINKLYHKDSMSNIDWMFEMSANIKNSSKKHLSAEMALHMAIPVLEMWFKEYADTVIENGDIFDDFDLCSFFKCFQCFHTKIKDYDIANRLLIAIIQSFFSEFRLANSAIFSHLIPLPPWRLLSTNMADLPEFMLIGLSDYNFEELAKTPWDFEQFVNEIFDALFLPKTPTTLQQLCTDQIRSSTDVGSNFSSLLSKILIKQLLGPIVP